MQNDKMTEYADWKDGINAFRLRMMERIEELEQKIEQLAKEKKNGSI